MREFNITLKSVDLPSLALIAAKMADRNVRTSGHKVVISGMSGRFPMANNVAEFQTNLLSKVDCTSKDHGRWDFGKKNYYWLFYKHFNAIEIQFISNSKFRVIELVF